ncbi:MAG TPA: SulP family inorganic anion transporter [Gammaproteobacteria bacterium]
MENTATQPQQCNLLWHKVFPFLRWRHRVTKENLRIDFIAALTGAIIVLPQGVAFAAIAGMPPEYGLYAAMIPAIIAALWGSSWHLVSGPTTAASIVLFASLSAMAIPGSPEYVKLALTLTFMVGLLELTMGLARLGTLVNFISHSVVIGFTAGAALLIAAKQMKNFFGVPIPRGLEFHEIFIQLFENLDKVNVYVLVVSVTTLVVGILVKRFARKIPYMIVAMLVGSIVAMLVNYLVGKESTGITTVGALPAVLPPLSSPEFSFETIKQLVPVAFAATILALTEAVSIARAIGTRSGQRVDGNQEFIGQGLSNMVGSFFSAYVATGSFNRSGVNYEAGARTPVAAAIAGVLLMGIVLLVAPYADYLPNAAMAGILFLVAWGLIDFHHIEQIIKTSRSETVILAATFFGTLFLELAFAILLGVLLSLGFYLYRTSRPRIASRVPDPASPRRTFVTDNSLPECPQMKIMRIDGSLFFGAVNHVEESMQHVDAQNPGQKHLMVVAQGINFVDIAGAEMLAKEAIRRHKIGGGLYFYDVKDPVCTMFKKGGYIDAIGDENVFSSKSTALSTIVTQRLDPEICRTCTKRIFKECAQMPGPDSN